VLAKCVTRGCQRTLRIGIGAVSCGKDVLQRSEILLDKREAAVVVIRHSSGGSPRVLRLILGPKVLDVRYPGCLSVFQAVLGYKV